MDGLTGRVLIRQLDPLYIKEIETDPDDLEHTLRYRWSPPGSGLSAVTQLDSGTWVDASEILHVTVNKVSNALRDEATSQAGR